MVGEKAAQGSARGWQQMLPEESILLLGPDLWEPSQILSLGGGGPPAPPLFLQEAGRRVSVYLHRDVLRKSFPRLCACLPVPGIRS